MCKYRIVLQVKGGTTPRKIYKWRTCKSLKEAWDKAREICTEYNRGHKNKAIVTGVGKN